MPTGIICYIQQRLGAVPECKGIIIKKNLKEKALHVKILI